MARRSHRFHWSAVVVGILAAVLAVEVALQAGAAVVYFSGGSERRADVVPGGAHTVLCVGDSFTFGIGASTADRSYPSALQAGLGAPWQVVNGGWPGRNSRELLENLAAQLDRHRPDVVCVLVGVNDRWTRPRPLPPGAELDGAEVGFAWRWRTARLASMVWAALRGDAEAESAGPPLTGAWYLLGERVEFAADGSGRFGEQPLSWRSRDALVEIEIPGAFHTVASWTDMGGKLLLTGVENGEELALERLDSMYAERIPAAWRAVEAGQKEFAQSLLAPLLRLTRDGDPWEVGLRRAAHGIAEASGGDAATEHARWLQERGIPIEAQPPTAVAETTGSGETGVAEVLGGHLRRIVALCRRHGAAPVLLTYPHDWPIRAVHREVASAAGVPFVDPVPRFAELRGADPTSELFVSDGHCSDRGYAEVAGLVAPAVRAAAGPR